MTDLTTRAVNLADDRATVERQLDDLMGEVLRRRRYGAIRPLWRDMPDDECKRRWRRAGARMVELFDRAWDVGK